jgi:hypothetical protein
MSEGTKQTPSHELDFHATASATGLSLKAKGAGLFVLLALTIAGIIFMGYQLTLKDSDSKGFVAIMFLMFIAQSLVATLDAVLGIRTTRSQ